MISPHPSSVKRFVAGGWARSGRGPACRAEKESRGASERSGRVRRRGRPGSERSGRGRSRSVARVCGLSESSNRRGNDGSTRHVAVSAESRTGSEMIGSVQWLGARWVWSVARNRPGKSRWNRPGEERRGGSSRRRATRARSVDSAQRGLSSWPEELRNVVPGWQRAERRPREGWVCRPGRFR